MNTNDFDDILYDRIFKIVQTLKSKGSEYSKNNDRLHNFRVAARIDNEHPKKSLWGMSKKHLVSVMDMVQSNSKYEHEYIDEKIGDMINYLILLEAILKEESINKKE